MERLANAAAQEMSEKVGKRTSNDDDDDDKQEGKHAKAQQQQRRQQQSLNRWTASRLAMRPSAATIVCALDAFIDAGDLPGLEAPAQRSAPLAQSAQQRAGHRDVVVDDDASQHRPGTRGEDPSEAATRSDPPSVRMEAQVAKEAAGPTSVGAVALAFTT